MKSYEKGTNTMRTPGGNQDLLCISESGLYRLILTSRKPQAEPFQDWVCQEVLPSIRKTGKYEAKNLQTQSISLLPADVRIDKLVTNLEKIGIDITNPRFKQEIQDLVMDKIIGGKTLSQSNEIWLGVVEKAEELGYSSALVTKNRSQLGKFVASFELESKKEKRLCSGTIRPINLYKDFMDAKVLAV